MNPQPQGQPGPAQGQQMRIPMYRPEQMRNLDILSDFDKDKYEKGLRGLYETMEKNPPESQAHLVAKNKISEFSRMVWGKVTTMRRQQAQQQAQQGQGGGPGQPGQQVPNQAALAAQRAANMAQQRPNPAANNGAAAPGAAGQARPAGAAPQVSQTVLQLANGLKIMIPAEMAGEPEKAYKYQTELKSKYIRALSLMETNQKKMQHMQALVQSRNAKNQPLSPEEQSKLSAEMENCKKMYSEGKRWADNLKAQASRTQAQPDAAAGQNGQPGGQATRPQQPASAGNTMMAATASVNAAMDAAKNLQSGTANRPSVAPPTPTTSGTTGPSIQATAAPATSAPPAQAQPAPAQPTQVKIEPGSQPHPPPVNTALATAAGTNIGPSAGTPTSARVQTPQTVTPTTAGPPGAARPLSHPAALALANKHSSTSVPTLGQQNHNAASANTPGSTGMNSTQSAPHSHAHPQQLGQHPGGAVPVPKMPIPKHLPDKAQQVPQPVATGGGVSAGRPTLGNGLGTAGGTMSQPVIQKNPAFTWEAEGEHVLSKKKLDELVRQICGGGQEGNYLTPDVEESVFNVADNFIDNVLNAACRLAKERGSKVLEIRDLQLVLERTYNIRVPGYTSDELRTVRKPQPNNAWLSKVSAVQAAKVTRDEK